MTDKNKKIKILTFGNSLTEGHGISGQTPDNIQYWMGRRLRECGYQPEILNRGIGGQLAFQITERIPKDNAADFIVIMAGTNDCWRFGNYTPDISEDMRKDVLEHLENGINYALKYRPVYAEKISIILCSIPAIRVTPATSESMADNIKKLAGLIRDLAEKYGDRNVFFCDVYSRMVGEDGYCRPDLVIEDGVHFTEEGNKTVGEAIADCIIKIISDGC